MKIAVMGAGALGGYFGARLADAGQDVWFIARGAHLAAMQTDGLIVESMKGDVHLPKVKATDNPAEVGVADVILFMVKNYDVIDSAHAIAPMIGPDTMVVTCQNGISAHERLGEIVGHQRVVPGVVRMPGDIPRPGVVRHTAPFDRFAFGELDGSKSDRVIRFYDALEAAGTMPEIPGNILHDLWIKFIMQASFASMTTITRLNVDAFRGEGPAQDLFINSMRETEKVARAIVPDLPDGIVEKVWALLESLPPTTHASMLDDLNNGKRLEVDYLGGDVVRLGKKYGIPTPIHETLWAALQPLKNGAA